MVLHIHCTTIFLDRISDIRIKVKELTEKRAILHMEVDVLANEGSDFNLKMINKATGQRLGKTDSLHKGMNTVEYDYFGLDGQMGVFWFVSRPRLCLAPSQLHFSLQP